MPNLKDEKSIKKAKEAVENFRKNYRITDEQFQRICSIFAKIDWIFPDGKLTEGEASTMLASLMFRAHLINNRDYKNPDERGKEDIAFAYCPTDVVTA